MKNASSVKASLAEIRKVIDTDVTDTDIVNVQNKLIKLTQLSGLSSECVAISQNLLGKKELEVLTEIKDESYPASIMSKMLNARTADETALLKYSDRINAAITHSIDGLRSIISLYKEEMSNNIHKTN